MSIPFTKMHGNGNDFVLLDNRSARLRLDGARLRAIADRRRGVGCDQVLVAEAPSNGASPVAMRVFNADGSEAEHCGNGLRCFAVFARAAGLVGEEVFDVDTRSGPMRAELLGHGCVRVSMGTPRLEPDDIPMAMARRAPSYAVEVDGEMVQLGAVSMGNPHAVLRVDSVDAVAVDRLGPAIQSLAIFPRGVNVGFMEVVGPTAIRLRVFERAVGETPACGSGACAAVVVGQVQGLLDEHVQVRLPGGELEVWWPGEGQAVWMTGPTARVFSGELEP